MSLPTQGWEMLIVRKVEQRAFGRIRTVGSYQVYHDGILVDGLSGAVAEPKGPGDNGHIGINRRIEAGRYPLWTCASGGKYSTLKYSKNSAATHIPRPGILVANTGKRIGIIIHPGRGFLSSIGAISLCNPLPTDACHIDFADSRARTIAIIDDIKMFVGSAFPTKDGRRIPNSFVIFEEGQVVEMKD